MPIQVQLTCITQIKHQLALEMVGYSGDCFYCGQAQSNSTQFFNKVNEFAERLKRNMRCNRVTLHAMIGRQRVHVWSHGNIKEVTTGKEANAHEGCDCWGLDDETRLLCKSIVDRLNGGQSKLKALIGKLGLSHGNPDLDAIKHMSWK